MWDTFNISLLVTGIISAFASMILVMTKRWHGKHSFDSTNGVQKFHVLPTPRIGGVAILISLTVAWLISPSPVAQLLAPMLIASLPAFVAGLTEDITKRVGVRERLLATFSSGVVAWWLTGYSLNHVNIGGADALLAYLPLSVAFTAFAVGGVANSINIIDGFNGLAAGTLMICFSALGLIAWQAGDNPLVELCLFLIVVVSGFFVVNFPFGKIFMGDGGAYLLGFMLAWVAVMLPMRNSSVSVWAPLLVCGYPVIETIFSMSRRYWNKTHAGQPDSAHMHSLIKVKIITAHVAYLPQYIRNSMVAPFCWVYALIPASFAVYLYKKTVLLAVALLFSFILYAIIYHLLILIKHQKEQQASNLNIGTNSDIYDLITLNSTEQESIVYRDYKIKQCKPLKRDLLAEVL